MSLARQMELREQYSAAAAAAPKAAPRGLLPAPQPRLALTYPQGSLQGSKAAMPNVTIEGRPVKRLNQAEQDERRRLGLCFNCDERYSRGHNKVCKRLFHLDCAMDDDDDDDTVVAADAPETESPVFSLHAVMGVPICDTMQITVSLGTTSFVALLDSGSTHNFIGEEVARRSRLPV
jgi:hypothetical protein